MSVQKALWVRTEDGSTAAGHPANVFRLLLQSLVPVPGVMGAGDLKVSQSGPSYNVSVADGRAVVAGTETGDQGSYYCPNVGALTVAVPPPDGTLDRHDLIVARVYDNDYGDAAGPWQIQVVGGTLSATPGDPALPANSLVLARVRVVHGAASYANDHIDDLRVLAGIGRSVAASAQFAPTIHQAIPSATDTKLTNFTVLRDTAALWNAGSSRYIVTTAGWYQVSASCAWAVNATGVRSLYIARNGGTGTDRIASAEGPAEASLSNRQSVSGLAYLSAGDYVEAYVYQNSGGGLDVTDQFGGTRFGLAYVGGA